MLQDDKNILSYLILCITVSDPVSLDLTLPLTGLIILLDYLHSLKLYLPAGAVSIKDNASKVFGTRLNM